MEIKKYWCSGCKKEHIKKIYENKSEGMMDIFMEKFFPIIWRDLKEESEKIEFEEFCRKLVETAIYNFHKNIRRIKVDKKSIKSNEENEKK